jgi:hypothetical protein
MLTCLPESGLISITRLRARYRQRGSVEARRGLGRRMPPPALGQDTKGDLNEVAGYAEEDIEALPHRGDVKLSEADLKLKT